MSCENFTLACVFKFEVHFFFWGGGEGANIWLIVLKGQQTVQGTARAVVISYDQYHLYCYGLLKLQPGRSVMLVTQYSPV